MTADPAHPAEIDAVECRLCRKSFRAVTNTHLVRAHAFDSAHPIAEYKARFGLERAECAETRELQIRSYRETLRRQGRLWTPERILGEILRRARDGAALNLSAVGRERPLLVWEAVRHFGSWKRALRAAGLDPERFALRRRWTSETLLGELRRLHAGGIPLTGPACDRQVRGISQAARRLFGTWRAALRAARLDPPPRPAPAPRVWTRARVLEELRTLAPAAPRAREVLRTRPALVRAAWKFWGSWARALEAAGVPPPRPPRRTWTPESILLEIRRRAESGRTLRARGVATACGGLWAAARREFGTWAEALRRAGVPADPPTGAPGVPSAAPPRSEDRHPPMPDEDRAAFQTSCPEAITSARR